MTKKTTQRSISLPLKIEDAIQTIRTNEFNGTKLEGTELGYTQTIVMLLKEALKVRGIQF